MGIRYKTLPKLLATYQTNNNMYTTKKATREQGLKAAAAARRAMKRHTCCKSQFKFKCFSCGEMINRGDKITRCMRGSSTGMELRYRGGDSQNGLTMAETAFYQAETGKDMWVHIGCYPCYWDKGYDNGDESSPPVLCAIQTEWGCKVYREFDDWTSGPGGESWLIMGVPYFLRVKGYPKEKFMRARISHAVTRFQALWRGYIFKKAYLIALQQQREQRIEDERCVMTPLTAGDIAMGHALAEQKFLRETNMGHRFGILFNRGEKREALYSGEITSICGEANGLVVYVRFHYDDERRKYHWKKFVSLTFECNKFMEKMGISQFHGVIFTQKR
jgi:hypothetical protein